MAGFEPLQHRQVGAHRLELALHAARALEHDQAELCGFGSPPAPDEDRHAELRLELANLVGDVRLHRVEGVGRGGERSLPVDGQQCLEMAELHGCPLPARPDGRFLYLDIRWTRSILAVGQIQPERATWWSQDDSGSRYPPRRLPVSPAITHSQSRGVHGGPWCPPPKRCPV